jgi:hypothetical protein
MSDRRRPGHDRPAQERTEQTQRLSQQYRTDTAPAHNGQPSYYPAGSYDPDSANPTGTLPQYWLQGQPPPNQARQPEPEKPRAPRWLWVAAAAAVLLVTALVIALVVADGSARRQTAVPALPSSQRPVPVVPRSPSHTAQAPAPATTEPGRPVDPSSMQTVVYSVTGDGRAISITYVDNDAMMQTEFNVALPWTKEVSLPESGSKTPNVTVVNIGHDVTCTVTVDGVDINSRTGVGLTICNGNG